MNSAEIMIANGYTDTTWNQKRANGWTPAETFATYGVVQPYRVVAQQKCRYCGTCNPVVFTTIANGNVCDDCL